MKQGMKSGGQKCNLGGQMFTTRQSRKNNWQVQVFLI